LIVNRDGAESRLTEAAEVTVKGKEASASLGWKVNRRRGKDGWKLRGTDGSEER